MIIGDEQEHLAMINLWFTNEADNGKITSKGTTAHKGVDQ